MRHTRRALVVVSALLISVACGTTTFTGANPSPSASPSAANPSPSASPSAVASPVMSPTPAPDYGPPPPGVALFYLQWPGSPTWLIGFDWSGTPRATVHLKVLDGHTDEIGSGILAAPNGVGFSSGAYTFDRLGRVIYQGPAPDKGSLLTTWSEDGQLLCGVQIQTSSIDSGGNGTEDFYLVRRSPLGPPVQVRRFLHLDFVSGDMGYTLVSCSHWLDRALLVKTVCCGVEGALVLRLSDGAQIGTWSRDGGQPLFSPDGQEVADPTWTPDGRTVSTEVRLVLGGTVLARYGAGVVFDAFSGDNRYAVVTNAGQTQVIEVATRRVVWRDASGRSLERVVARPFSGDLILAFKDPGPIDEIAVVRSDGSSTAIAGAWLVPMSWGSVTY